MEGDNFVFPILTVDGVVFQLQNDKLTVLLIKRGFDPFRGSWALPGGYIPAHETSRMALDRVLTQKAGISTKQLNLIEQPYAFDGSGRDPRGYAVTVMYIGLGESLQPGSHPGMTNGQNPHFLPISELPQLAYDHNKIVSFAHDRLKALALRTDIVAPLLPKTFTLSEMQLAYEAIFGKLLDKRNFRKKILSLGFIEQTSAIDKGGTHRPAHLYRFRSQTLQPFSQNFV